MTSTLEPLWTSLTWKVVSTNPCLSVLFLEIHSRSGNFGQASTWLNGGYTGEPWVSFRRPFVNQPEKGGHCRDLYTATTLVCCLAGNGSRASSLRQLVAEMSA